MDAQAEGAAVFMCRLCNLFSPSHSELLFHCSQVHQQQGPSPDLIITLKRLDPHIVEKPSENSLRKKPGRPKGSVNKKNKTNLLFGTQNNIETVRESKIQDETAAICLECKECHRTFRNKRQILKHICLKEEEEEYNDSSISGTPKIIKRLHKEIRGKHFQSKEKTQSAANKKPVVKVFLTEDETLPDVIKMIPVEEEEDDESQDTPQCLPQEKTTNDALSNDELSNSPKTEKEPSFKPTSGGTKGIQEYSIQGNHSSPQSQIKIFSCEFCNKIFKFRHSLMAHIRTHTQEKPFECPHCDYASAIKANLNVHLRKHTGDKFHCEHCSFTCISTGHLKVHNERVHLKVKQHCSFCKSKYSDVKNLLKHMEKQHNLSDIAVNRSYQQLRLKTRQGFRQLLFHCPTCKRCFKCRQERDRHLLVHEPQPPFGCLLCDYAATRLSGLTTHVRKHYFLYVCIVCKHVFVSSHRLKTHLTEFHSELAQDETFSDSISISYQLIQAGGGIWGQNSEKNSAETSQDETLREEVIQNTIEELLESPISELEMEQDIAPGALNSKIDSAASLQNSQTEMIKPSVSQNKNKVLLSTNSKNAETAKEQEGHKLERLVGNNEKTEATSEFSINDKKKTLQSGKESVVTENSFLQVLSSIQKTQLNIEMLQQLRKVYGELECEYCGKLFVYKVHYNNHVRTHTKEHLQYCSQCDYSAVTKTSLSRHMIHKHSDLLLSCPNVGCNFTTPDKYKLQTHIRRFHEETKIMSCPVCNDKFSEHRLKLHIRKMHRGTVQDHVKSRMEKQVDKCPYCDSYYLKNSSDLQQHIWTHEGKKPYTCNLCNYAGCRKSNLRLHMNRHKTEKIHLCDLCGKKFKSEVSLKIHTRSHTIEGRKFKCSECDFSTALKPSLTRHLEQHTRGRQAFQCAHCLYSFDKMGPLKRHYRRRHPNKKFTGAETEITESPEALETKGFKCPVCDSAHENKQDLNHHLKNKHRLNVLQISFEETDATQFVPVENEMHTTEVPEESLQDTDAVNILQQITEMNSDMHNTVTPMVAMAPGTVTVMEQKAEQEEVSSDQLMVVNADEDLGADQLMVVEEAEGLEALTVLTQGDNTHHYIVYVQEQTVEIDNN